MFIYLILNTMSFFLYLIGFRGIRLLAVCLGILMFDILRIRRGLILENLNIAFDETKTHQEKIKIGRASVISFLTTMLEFFPSSRLFPKMQVTYTNKEIPAELISRNQGLYAMCIHMSNWEFLCHVNSREIPISVVVKPIGKGALAKWVEETRAAIGFHLIDRKGKRSATHQIFEAIEKKEAVGFIVDQKRSAGQVLPFFGRPASTNDSLAKLCLRKAAPIVPVILKRTGFGKYHIIYFPEFIVSEDPSLSFQEKVTEITKKMNLQVEEMIRMNPEEYFWMHNRWNLKK
jgi:KDO2-lipid IV(A) lauroyltransferase